MPEINETHDPTLESWAGTSPDFPIQNLPMAVFRPADSGEPFRGGVAIGEKVLDLAAVAERSLYDGKVQQGIQAASDSELNDYMGLGPSVWTAVRRALSRSLRTGSPDEAVLSECLHAMDEIEYKVPCRIGDYTDFYTSVYHATAVGRQFRPDNPLLPNYKWVPIGYHGRSSSIGVSPQSFRRPAGQLKAPDETSPHLAACRRLDYELELGIYTGPGNPPGQAIPVEEAEDHVFGLCLFNDWSARDIQGWEYQPLGPFLAKNFASTVSPWIVSLEALAPFRLPFSRDAADPQPLPYLSSEQNRESGAMDIQVEAYLLTREMSKARIPAVRLSHTSFRHSYWTVAQLVAHHTVNGCNLNPGDLLGSGTQSGPSAEEAGSLLELSHGGRDPLTMPTGELRSFLEDGDTVIFRGYCERQGAARIGFGEAVGTVLPASPGREGGE